MGDGYHAEVWDSAVGERKLITFAFNKKNIIDQFGIFNKNKYDSTFNDFESGASF